MTSTRNRTLENSNSPDGLCASCTHLPLGGREYLADQYLESDRASGRHICRLVWQASDVLSRTESECRQSSKAKPDHQRRT